MSTVQVANSKQKDKKEIILSSALPTASVAAIKLICQLLSWNPAHRITARSALVSNRW